MEVEKSDILEWAPPAVASHPRARTGSSMKRTSWDSPDKDTSFPKTSAGKRCSENISPSSSFDPSASDRAATSHGRHARAVGMISDVLPDPNVEVYLMDPVARKRATTSHDGKRPSHAAIFPGEAHDSAGSMLGASLNSAPPSSAQTRRRNRSTPLDPGPPAPKNSFDSDLSLVDFSSNTRKELSYFDPGTFTHIECDQDANSDKRSASLQRAGSFKTASKTKSSTMRVQRNTVVGPNEAELRQHRRPTVQKGGSFKGYGSLKRDNSFKGTRRDDEDVAAGIQRMGSFRGGQAAPQVSLSSKGHQRIAHITALNKPTSWRASPTPSPKTSPQEGTFSFLSRWKESIFGGGESQNTTVSTDNDVGLSEARSGGNLKGRLNVEISMSVMTKQLDDSDYVGSNRPRDNIAPSERLKYSVRRNSQTDKDGSESSVYKAGTNTSESSIIYPKPHSEKVVIDRFKIDEGQKALEKRLLISSAEAMHKYPGITQP